MEDMRAAPAGALNDVDRGLADKRSMLPSVHSLNFWIAEERPKFLKPHAWKLNADV